MIAAALVALAGNPRPPGCVKLAGAEDLWRLRVRQYRVIYQILDDQLIVTVVKIGDRKDADRVEVIAANAGKGAGVELLDNRRLAGARCSNHKQ